MALPKSPHYKAMLKAFLNSDSYTPTHGPESVESGQWFFHNRLIASCEYEDVKLFLRHESIDYKQTADRFELITSRIKLDGIEWDDKYGCMVLSGRVF